MASGRLATAGFQINLEGAKDLGPLAVKYSWASAELAGKFTALTFLSNYTSLHAVQTELVLGNLSVASLVVLQMLQKQKALAETLQD